MAKGEIMSKEVYLVIALAALAHGCGTVGTRERPPLPKDVRVIRAVCVAQAPAIDGRLDDACWTQAQEVTAFRGYSNIPHAAYGPHYFRTMGLDTEVERQSFAYVCYDDTHLYVGVKCLLPEGQAKPDDPASLSGDKLSVMLDPGNTRSAYRQFDAKNYGPAQGGEGRVHVGEGFYSVEMAIPFCTLPITPEVGSTWGINITRQASAPLSLSSISVDGALDDPTRFAVLEGLRVDFSKYAFEIGPGLVALDARSNRTRGTLRMPVANRTGEAANVRIAVQGKGAAGELEVREAELAPNETVVLNLGEVNIGPVFAVRTDRYFVTSAPHAERIVVSDAETGEVRALAFVEKPTTFEAIRLVVDDPWQSEIAQGKTPAISLKVLTNVVARDREGGTLLVTVTSDATGEAAATREIRNPARETDIRFSTQELDWGAYSVRAAFRDDEGKEIVAASGHTSILPGGKQQIRVLNNFASELMDAGERGLLSEKKIEFMNPRKGWCFFVISGEAKVRLDDEQEPLADGGTVEVMRRLPAGRHTLHIEGRPSKLVVRSIPVLQYAFAYTHKPTIQAYGPYDWEFLSKDVTPNINALPAHSIPPAKDMEWWAKMGRSWIIYAPNVFRLHGRREDNVTPDEAYKVWSEYEGLKHPGADGLIMDEFGGGNAPGYDSFRLAVEKISADPKFKNKMFSVYVYGIGFHRAVRSREFGRACIEGGGFICLERYLSEQPSREAAEKHIQDMLVSERPSWEEAIPGVTRQTVMVLSYLTTTESDNTNPGADYKVYMDMQMKALATDPAFFGLAGLQWYAAGYCDEENVRWGGRLFRHYCIEGNTDLLSQDPYELAHVRNPDFADGTSGWDIRPAQPGSIAARKHPGYGHLQGRYWEDSWGDTFLWTKRSAKQPNVFSQVIKDLTPGRLYSMKMITGDYQDLIQEKSEKKTHGVSIRLDDVEILSDPRKSFDYLYPNNYAHGLGKFDRKYNYWMTYHSRVFRAKGSAATLTVSDWKTEKDPDGPIGQELMYNFIEIQPYSEE